MIAQVSSSATAARSRVATILTRSLLWLAPLAFASLAACGGGDAGTSSTGFVGGSGLSSSSSSSSSSSNGAGDGWVQGVFAPEAQYQARCQNPRTGTDPTTGQRYPDVQGSTLDENFWLRSWTNDLYLWYDEVADADPGTYSTTASYFAVMQTMAKTSTGNYKDRFHFTMPTSQWEQFSGSGADIGYGLTWAFLAERPPRKLVVAYAWPGNYPAANAGLMRGAQILTVDGVDLVNGSDVNTLNQGISPTSAGESHTFTYQNPGSSTTLTVTLTAQAVTETPVPLVTTLAAPNGPVGYILFNDVIATSEQELIDAINQLKAANVTDLVLDLRYDGGGYLDIASELAYMIAGPARIGSAYFDKISFNSKYPTIDPVTRQTITPTPFESTASGSFSAPAGTALPHLDLPRLFVITGNGTCSASEAVMNGLNGLAGAGFQVIQIGSTTCGKPYGFYPQDNCGTTYFSIEFQGNNAAGFGNYPDGFSPQNAMIQTSAVLPGCSVADDFTQPLGDASEARLAAALDYRSSSSCPAPTGEGPPPTLHGQDRLAIHPPFWREMRILRRRPQ